MKHNMLLFWFLSKHSDDIRASQDQEKLDISLTSHLWCPSFTQEILVKIILKDVAINHLKNVKRNDNWLCYIRTSLVLNKILFLVIYSYRLLSFNFNLWYIKLLWLNHMYHISHYEEIGKAPISKKSFCTKNWKSFAWEVNRDFFEM